MKPSAIQSPKIPTRGKLRSDAKTIREKPLAKIVAKSLSSDFSTASPEVELSPDQSDSSADLSLDSKSTVKDPPEKAASPPLLAFLEEEEESGTVLDSDSVEEEEVRDPAVVVDRLREALLEIRKARDVSGGSKKVLEALVRELGGDRQDGLPDQLIVRAKARIVILFFLICLVAVVNVLVLSAAVWRSTAGDGQADSGLPPT